MKKIEFSIPKPCHEDWNKMSPRERGRFCDKCAKTVLDFTSKNDEEIQEYVTEHQGEKLCGRFRNDQLKKPVQIRIFYKSMINRISYAQAFLVSLLIAFGTTLFSCTTHSNNTVGEFIINDAIKIDSLPADDTDSSDLNVMVDVIKGEFIDPVKVSPASEVHEQEIAEETDSINYVVDLPAVDIFSEHDEIYSIRTVGMIVCYSDGELVGSENNESTDSLSTETTEVGINEVKEESNIFPNPAHEMARLKFNISAEKDVEVNLFDLNGKLIRSILPSQKMSQGEREIQIDLSGLKPATYLVRIIKGGVVEAKRIVVL